LKTANKGDVIDSYR